jgi:hypothetical protein
VTPADTLESVTLACELGMAILAAYFVHLGRTTDTSSAGYVAVQVCALVLSAMPVFMGLWYVCDEHRLKGRRDILVESSGNQLDESNEAKAQQTAVAYINPLDAQEDS